jgi:hypothetical protein
MHIAHCMVQPPQTIADLWLIRGSSVLGKVGALIGARHVPGAQQAETIHPYDLDRSQEVQVLNHLQ